MTEQKPSVGRVVHFVSHGTPVRGDGSQAYTSECRAAIVTGVYHRADDPTQLADRVDLAVLNPTGMFFNQHVAYDAGGTSDTPGAPTGRSYEGGTWHWPERV